jgi:Protein of unknown function (DUF3800)
MLGFVDESGDRAHTAKSSDHFVMAAVVVRDADRPAAANLLAQLRIDLGRAPGQVLHWVNIKSHAQRLHVAQSIGSAAFIRVTSVIVCKRHFPVAAVIPHEDVAYLYTLRFLLERLSWLGRAHGGAVDYTLAHIVRFPTYKLRQYEARLRSEPGCKIKWNYIAGPGSIDQPSRLEELQLADLTASAIAAAFEPDAFGNTERRYLEELSPRLYRHNGNLTSYGLKMHPWNAASQAAYPWVQAL